ncbi:MAG TPA: DUF4097 family beta strand repeat-containing protein [Candidatus Babeliales bacterium]|nr:DUF4097 family beta strand repeat-containing protein [Candidatus Babeliales bacterium]
MRRWLLLLPLLGLTACNAAAPFVTTVGMLKPGATLVIRAGEATISAYQPAVGQRRDLFTIAATAPAKGPPPPPPHLRPEPRYGVVVTAPGRLATLLVRVPDGVDLVVQSLQGDVNVTDITGNARLFTRRGNVTAMLPGYAEASTGDGDVSVTMGAVRWPGTLHFSTPRGDIELRINPKAALRVRLHTGDGTLFTDFGLRGVSNGASETIDADINGGSAQRIDVETESGAIRLLRLQPQA